MKKLLAVALMVMLASPAFAAIQNVKVSGDITTSWVNRNNFNFGMTEGTLAAFTDGDFGTTGSGSWDPIGLKRQNVFITQTRLRVDADLSDNVSTTVGLINERAWNAENTPPTGFSSSSFVGGFPGTPPSIPATNVSALDTNVQLYLASITLREFLYSPLSVTIGRQVFNFGNGLILGDGGVNNQATGNLQYIAQDLTMRTSYDGVHAVLDYKPLTIDLIYFKNQQLILNGNVNQDQSSSDVYGFNANYQLSDPMSTLLEVYMFSRINGKSNLSAQGAPTGAFSTLTGPTDKPDTMYVPGLRVSTNPVKGLNVQGEVAWELGNHPVVGTSGVQQSEHREAMAAQFLASYALPVMEKYKPTVNASYTYVSGDKNAYNNYAGDHVSSAKVYSAWDPFNENQGSGTIYNSIFALSNMHIVSLGASVNPLEDVTAAFTWSGLWAAQAYTDSPVNPLLMYQPDSGAIQYLPSTKHNNTGLGNEYDVNFTYNYTEDVTFGLSLGWFLPGDAFSSVNSNAASQAIADVAVKF